MSKQIFYFEMTDTFGGETNYSWIKRFAVRAKTLRGAVSIVSREFGYNFRSNHGKYGGNSYKAIRACIALYEVEVEDSSIDENVYEAINY